MSTKNLARTVMEGGRRAFARSRKASENAGYRRRVRTKLNGARGDAELGELAFPRYERGNRDFDDKLGPPKRWLASQVGRPWNKVRSELFERFDTRTTAGRHIVYCHMLEWVDDDGTAGGCFHCHPPFLVDAHGILRHGPPWPFRRRRHEPLPRDGAELERWLAGRRVGARQDILFWFVVTPRNAYRQHQRLSDDDAALWLSLPRWFREKNDPAAPPPPLHNRN